MIVQVCRWEFLIFSGTFETTLSVSEHPDEGRLVFGLLESAFMRNFHVCWQVKRSILCQASLLPGVHCQSIVCDAFWPSDSGHLFSSSSDAAVDFLSSRLVAWLQGTDKHGSGRACSCLPMLCAAHHSQCHDTESESDIADEQHGISMFATRVRPPEALNGDEKT